jgi:hypothetical protein
MLPTDEPLGESHRRTGCVTLPIGGIPGVTERGIPTYKVRHEFRASPSQPAYGERAVLLRVVGAIGGCRFPA